MSIKAVLFDLDGTLLPMDQDTFVKCYFGLIAKKLAPVGYEPKKLMETIWMGTEAMVRNDGEKTNEEVFWDCFAKTYGEKVTEDITYFDEFYREDFDKVSESCGYNPLAAKAVKSIKDRGLRVVLATNPIFPSVATEKRMGWAGFSPDDFELYTTYENSRYCKPNPKYYLDIVEALGVSPSECLMVGNDVSDDMIAETLGMKVFLMPANLINKQGKDISAYPGGDFEQLLEYVDSLVS